MCPIRQNMLQELMEVDFFLYDLSLYLDTHPTDRRALLTFNDYLKRAKVLRENYERAYGPLTHATMTNGLEWQWVEGAWPWEYQYN